MQRFFQRNRFTILLTLFVAIGVGACLDPDDSALPPTPPGFVFVPAGSFRMGEPTDPLDPIEGTRRMHLGRPFVLSETEVTLRDYLPLLNTAWAASELYIDDRWLWDAETQQPLAWLPFDAAIHHDFPSDSFVVAPGVVLESAAGGLTWYGAALYCDWRNRAEGLPESYERSGFDWICGPQGNPYDAEGWRLPTEAEWEFAARFPDERRYPWGELPPDCYLTNSPSEPGGALCADGPLPPGLHSPAGDSYLGLRDLAGNVSEWCQDWYGEWLYFDPLTNPVDVNGGLEAKSLRGGEFSGPSDALSAWYRDHLAPEAAGPGTGLRLARTWTY